MKRSLGWTVSAIAGIALSCLAASLMVQGVLAQDVDAEPCRKDNMGNAFGAGACFDFKLKIAEQKLFVLEERYKRRVIAGSDNPQHAMELVAKEQKIWRAYRDAKCALAGETEGGLDSWKNVWAVLCAATETESRVTVLRKKLAAK